MKKIVNYIGAALVLGLVIFAVVRIQNDREDKIIQKSNERIEALKIENANIIRVSDSLRNSVAVLEYEMDEMEKKADSLGEIANIEMPCEHELELRKKEITYVRKALTKCKEAKTIQTTRVGLAEIRVNNEVKLCSEVVTIHKSELKKEKRKSFFKGAGVGGVVIGILIILAL